MLHERPAVLILQSGLGMDEGSRGAEAISSDTGKDVAMLVTLDPGITVHVLGAAGMTAWQWWRSSMWREARIRDHIWLIWIDGTPGSQHGSSQVR